MTTFTSSYLYTHIMLYMCTILHNVIVFLHMLALYDTCTRVWSTGYYLFSAFSKIYMILILLYVYD